MLYKLRVFRFARKIIGGAWVKTKHRGWITYQTYIDYMGYGFDPVVLMSEENGIIKWRKKAEIYNVQPGNDMQCGVGKNNNT